MPAIDRGAELPAPACASRASRAFARRAAANFARDAGACSRPREVRASTMIVYGINPVLEALRAGRVTASCASAPRADGASTTLLALARQNGCAGRARRRRRRSIARRAAACIRASSPMSRTPRDYSVDGAGCAARAGRAADRRARRHRGSAQRRRDPADRRRGGRARRRPAGAACRARSTARRPRRRRARWLTCGSPTVVNIARAVEELKDAGVWTVGLAGDAPIATIEVDLTAADGARPGRRGHRAAAAGAGALRSAGRRSRCGGMSRA